MAVMPMMFRGRAPLQRMPQAPVLTPQGFDLVSEEGFLLSLTQERKRCDRTGRPFLLLLLSRQNLGGVPSGLLIEKVVAALCQASRDTDIVGWYEESAVIGVLFTELPEDPTAAVQRILTKITETL